MDDNTILSKIIKLVVGIIASVIAGIIVYVITTGNAPQLFVSMRDDVAKGNSIVDKNTSSTDATDDSFSSSDLTSPSVDIIQSSDNYPSQDTQSPPHSEVPEKTEDENESIFVPWHPYTNDKNAGIEIDFTAGFVLDDVYHWYDYENKSSDAAYISNAEQVAIDLTFIGENVTGWTVTIGLPNSSFAVVLTDSYSDTLSFACSPGQYVVEVLTEIEGKELLYSSILIFEENSHHYCPLSSSDLIIQ